MVFDGQFFSGDHLRWNLGWPTPNYAGAFLATLLGLAFAATNSRGRWIWMIVEALGLALLAKTYSRGAVVAWAMAWLFGVLASRSWTCRKRWGPWVARLGLLGILTVAVDFSWSREWTGGSRVSSIGGDGSVANRLALWRAGLEMIEAAPLGGWGKGESGRVYMNWFQAPNGTEGYRTMVNGYLHVAAERGLPLLSLVVFVLGSLIAVAWRGAYTMDEAAAPAGISHRDVATGAGGSLVAWATANLFSTIWIDPWLWITPGVAGVLLGWFAWRSRSSLLTWSAGAGACAAVLVAGGLYCGGRYSLQRSALRIEPVGHGVVAIGAERGKSREEWQAWPDEVVLGVVPGQELRRWLEWRNRSTTRLLAHPLVSSEGDAVLPRTNGVLLFGRQAARVSGRLPVAWDELWIIHPTVIPRPLKAAPDRRSVIFVVLPQTDEIGNGGAWRRWAEKNQARVIVAQNSGLDIRATWPDVVAPPKAGRAP